jgi:soluble lytic murein transglycosylase
MQVGMKAEAASELALLQGLLPRRYGALMGVSKAFFELGDYYRSLVIILRNFERLLERPSMRFPEELWLLAYPQGYWTSILNSSRKYGVDPYFIAAIIRQESQFRTEALSPAGALGIMQVMPKTGEWIARSAGLSGFDRSRLFDADVNISLGAWYLSFLMKRFQGDLYLVSAAYNAGPEVVRAWAGKDGVASDPAVFVETIPYSETRGYVKKVLRNYAEYRRIYSGNGAMPAPSSPPSGKHPDEEGNAAGLQWCSSAEACP